MGHTDLFAKAREMLQKELAFDVEGEAVQFRAALDKAGIKRFEHVVILVKMWARPGVHGLAKYDRLMKLLWLVTPDKIGKYRNAESGHGVEVNAALDAEMMDRIARDK